MVPIIFSTDDTSIWAGLGHAGIADVRAAVHVHRHPQEGDGGGQGVVDPSDLGDFDARRSATSFR
jgi:hypothetical protein